MAARKPRIVLDTNVVVSSLWGGAPRQVLDQWRDGRSELLISMPILKEYLEVLARFRLSNSQLHERGLLFLEAPHTSLIRPTRDIAVVTRDPDDNMFLECATAGDADSIVSGDKHLLDMNSFEGIPILTPRRYLGWKA